MADIVQGIVLHDIDVTDGPQSVSVMTQGIINENLLDSDTQNLFESSANSLPKIKSIKR